MHLQDPEKLLTLISNAAADRHLAILKKYFPSL